MSVSPPMEITGQNPEITARTQLAYLAELFKGTLQAKPAATLQITGPSRFYTEAIAQALINLQIPSAKINQSGFSQSWQIIHEATVVINYGDGNPHKRKFKVQFKPDSSKDFPIEVEFEVAPDGSMLTEMKAEWSTPLKKVIDDSPRLGVRELKFATKIVGLAGFEQKTVMKIETELKAKLKPTLSFYLKTKGLEHLKITFYGEIGLKYADDKTKVFGGGGVLFEMPFDITDVFK